MKGIAHTNTLEGAFSIFKRGMNGVYQHCSEKHLHRYLSEFDFRYNAHEAVGVNDEMRAGPALTGISGMPTDDPEAMLAWAKRNIPQD